METTSMDSSVQKSEAVKAKIQKQKPVMKKLDPATGKILAQLNEKANKKDRGRKIRDSEIIALGLKLITDDHIKELQEQCYTEKDRLHLAHENFVKKNGKISLDQFIGRLLKASLKDS